MNTPDPRAKPETQEGGYGAPSPSDELAPTTETELSHARRDDTTGNSGKLRRVHDEPTTPRKPPIEMTGKNPTPEAGTDRTSEDADLDAANAEPQHGDRESFSSETNQEASGDPERGPHKP